MNQVIHGARRIDADGIVDDFWLATDGDRIRLTGTGGDWRDHAEDAEATDAGGAWLSPGFIDLHAHGAGGFDFDHGIDGMRSALAVHRAHGTTRSVLSLVTNPLTELISSLETIADLVDEDPLVLGSHLEGPFLSTEYKGAHDAELLRAPDGATIASLIAAARGTLRQITIAPELTGASAAIEAFVDADVVVAIGHTAADYDTALEAFERGATVLTHAFNAMPGLHHRMPGPVAAAVDSVGVVLELILDGVHVHPSIASLAFAAAPGRIALVTDAMAAAGGSDGLYPLGGLSVEVVNGIARIAGTDTIAGSTLTSDAALRTAITGAGIDRVTAVTALTSTPARVLGLDFELGLLQPGYLADAVLLDADWNAHAVWGAGNRLA